jgi:hypothetical protein
MSLNLNRLENVRELASGIVQARCPACAEGGHDRSREHLRIYPDGRFGCCVYPKDREHRKRIFALVGIREPGTFTVRIKGAAPVTTPQSVKAALTGFSAGTLGTGKSESETSEKLASQASQDFTPELLYSHCNDFGTFGTGLSELRAYTREDLKNSPNIVQHFYMELKDSEHGVPSVPTFFPADNSEASSPLLSARLPYFTHGGTLAIPFDAPDRYHWWRGGQSVAATLQELNERMNDASDF